MKMYRTADDVRCAFQGCGSVFIEYSFGLGSSISTKFWIRILRFIMSHFAKNIDNHL